MYESVEPTVYQNAIDRKSYFENETKSQEWNVKTQQQHDERTKKLNGFVMRAGK